MFKLFRKLDGKDVFYIFVCFILIFFQVWLDLKLPDYMSAITRLVQTTGSHMSDILVQGGYMLLCALGSLASAVVVGYFASKISSNFSRKLRKEIFEKVEYFGMEEIKKFSTSSLITRTTNDVTQVEMLIGMGLQMLMKAPTFQMRVIILKSRKIITGYHNSVWRT